MRAAMRQAEERAEESKAWAVAALAMARKADAERYKWAGLARAAEGKERSAVRLGYNIA